MKVERRPVNQRATETDMAAFKEGSMDLRETSEETVVGKGVSERTETVRDTVRRTDVEVEQRGASGNRTTPVLHGKNQGCGALRLGKKTK